MTPINKEKFVKHGPSDGKQIKQGIKFSLLVKVVVCTMR